MLFLNHHRSEPLFVDEEATELERPYDRLQRELYGEPCISLLPQDDEGDDDAVIVEEQAEIQTGVTE